MKSSEGLNDVSSTPSRPNIKKLARPRDGCKSCDRADLQPRQGTIRGQKRGLHVLLSAPLTSAFMMCADIIHFLTGFLMTRRTLWGQTCISFVCPCCPPRALTHSKSWGSAWVSQWKCHRSELWGLDFDSLLLSVSIFSSDFFKKNPAWCFCFFVLLWVLVTTAKLTHWFMEKYVQIQGQGEICLHTRFCPSFPGLHTPNHPPPDWTRFSIKVPPNYFDDIPYLELLSLFYFNDISCFELLVETIP